MKSKKLQDSLNSYSALAGVFLAGAGAANAQFLYVDLDPDVTVDMSNSPFNLDMNGDQIDDFKFEVNTITGSSTMYYGLLNFTYSGVAAGATGLNGSVVGYFSTSQSMNAVSALSNGVGIEVQSFVPDGMLAGNVDVVFTGMYSGSYTNVGFGNFSDVTDGYMGVSFDVGGNTHYGWIRLSIPMSSDVITIKDYAFNEMPGGAISAGQIVGLEEVSIENKVHFITTLDQTIVNITPDLIGAELTVTDISGKSVSTEKISDLNTTIGHSDLNAGIYIVSVNHMEESMSKKIYIR
jgi:hypothetical protein